MHSYNGVTWNSWTMYSAAWSLYFPSFFLIRFHGIARSATWCLCNIDNDLCDYCRAEDLNVNIVVPRREGLHTAWKSTRKDILKFMPPNFVSLLCLVLSSHNYRRYRMNETLPWIFELCRTYFTTKPKLIHHWSIMWCFKLTIVDALAKFIQI